MKSTSIWIDQTNYPSFSELDRNLDVEVAIVGAGITGITTAYLLGKAGYKVALLEADTIAKGTTGHTTAKVSIQHDVIYHELMHHIGKERARNYYKANQEALEFMNDMVHEHGIDCDWTEQNAYIYTDKETTVEQLQQEARAYEQLGITGKYLSSIPIDLPTKAGLVVNNQAQFNPRKYLLYFVQQLADMDVHIFEHTPVTDVIEGRVHKVETKSGYHISCHTIVACSHFPFYDKGFYFSRMYAERSYVIAAPLNKQAPKGMYLSADEPKRSIRTANLNGNNFILIGGESHKTGQSEDIENPFHQLQQFGKRYFDIQEPLYQWSAQDLTTLDNIPYVGQITTSRHNILIATGFRKWGMTNGTAAALLLTDLVQKQPSPYEDVFAPSRFYADPSIKHFLMQNVNVASQLMKGKLEITFRQPEDLQADEGATIYYNNQRAGAYKNTDGDIYIVDTTCTHLGCEVEWNNDEKSWDCPCHGSRFSIEGEVLEGPAKKSLKRFK
ncbi:FAD-dependent oxidoreductase [Pontibacillus litoralis]|uniref:(2Fe-2S)-binding protein n=1 Tax=Pontibacillus litoralis JSM 072002 TaxID=1385512 RepID=A0A0A5G2A9_9BACI|nr:FAD-dependent oxidoreductase [Pontibacillus litoralis]KGX87236.1 (2Fe-2S)-binding protein [Pontibacillus litoralis JSM 072002]